MVGKSLYIMVVLDACHWGGTGVMLKGPSGGGGGLRLLPRYVGLYVNMSEPDPRESIIDTRKFGYGLESARQRS